MADGLHSSESGLNPASGKASSCPSGSRSHPRHCHSIPGDSRSGWGGRDGEPRARRQRCHSVLSPDA